MTDIKIEDNPTRISYIATAGQTVFTFNFQILTATDIKVYKTLAGATPDDLTDILPPSAYTVTIVPTTGKGYITLTTGAAINDQITLDRQVPYTQDVDYSVGGSFTAASVNAVIDKLTLEIQQVKDLLKLKGLTYQVSDDIDNDHDNTIRVLADGQIWKKVGDNIIAVDLDESPDVGTLRSELASDVSGSDGAKLIGYNDYLTSSGITLKQKLDNLTKNKDHFGVASGTNAYTVSIPGVTAYEDGLTVYIKIVNGNTTSSSININSLGAIPIYLPDAGNIPSGYLLTGVIYQFTYWSDFGIFRLNFVPYSTENNLGVIQNATNSEIIIGTNPSKAITPLNLKHAKAFARVEAAGTLTFSKNLSVVKGATGIYTYTFTSPLPNNNYTVIVSISDNSAFHAVRTEGELNTGFTVLTGNASGSGLQDANHYVTIIGNA